MYQQQVENIASDCFREKNISPEKLTKCDIEQILLPQLTGHRGSASSTSSVLTRSPELSRSIV